MSGKIPQLLRLDIFLQKIGKNIIGRDFFYKTLLDFFSAVNKL